VCDIAAALFPSGPQYAVDGGKGVYVILRLLQSLRKRLGEGDATGRLRACQLADQLCAAFLAAPDKTAYCTLNSLASKASADCIFSTAVCTAASAACTAVCVACTTASAACRRKNTEVLHTKLVVQDAPVLVLCARLPVPHAQLPEQRAPLLVQYAQLPSKIKLQCMVMTINN
jgi:hypothetical protein